jgi:hypothetical protein
MIFFMLLRLMVWGNEDSDNHSIIRGLGTILGNDPRENVFGESGTPGRSGGKAARMEGMEEVDGHIAT